MTTLTYSDIASAIVDGLVDDDLDSIKNAIETRRQALARVTMFSLRPGDRVRIHDIRPKAINGMIGTVVRVNKSRVSITLPPEAGRHAGPCTVPGTCCTKVD